MEPTIGRSVKAGFAAAGRSWMGMALWAGVWLLVGLASWGVAVQTHAPASMTNRMRAQWGGMRQSVWDQWQTQLAEARARQASTAAGAEAANTPLTAEQQEQAEWMRRSWPVLLLGGLAYFAVALWLWGGQMGYLVQQVEGRPASMGTFASSGGRSFVPLLGQGALGFAGVIGVVIAVALVALVLALGGTILPQVVIALAVVLLIIAGMAAGIWASVRLCCWSVAIVADRLGPVAGLRAGWRATRGRWGRAAGLLTVVILLYIAAMIPLALLSWLVRAVSPAIVVVNLGIWLAQVYLSFVMTAACIRFYLDAKSAAAGPVTPAM